MKRKKKVYDDAWVVNTRNEFFNLGLGYIWEKRR